MVVEAFSVALRPRFDVAGVAYDGQRLVALANCCPADCLLLDIALPGQNGLQLVPRVRAAQPEMRILVVTMFLDRAIANAALDAGADGIVPKDAPLAELELAISEVLAGRRYVSPRLPKTSHRVGLQARHQGLERLTPRQQDIVRLFGEGKSETEMARALGVGLSTITFHKHNLMRALGVESDAALKQLCGLLHADAQTALPYTEP
jgi:DNA-binding NarL/FixJ family response regulator